MYKIDLNKFKNVFSNCSDSEVIVNLLDNILAPEGIDTKERVNMFLAQCGHESGGFRVFEENLNYSDKGLRVVFGKYFKSDSEAKIYARNPEKIANKVYANRMGNDSEASGDGWKYRGRGAIQLTGKSNYDSFSKDTGIDIVSNPDIMKNDYNLIFRTAIWFWNKNNLNRFADSNDIGGCTKIINGGTHGLEDRTKIYRSL